MRLITRLTVVFATTGLLLFGASGLWQLHAESVSLRAAVERELRFTVTPLRIGAENALRDGQLFDIEETTLRLDGLDAQVDVYILNNDGHPVVEPLSPIDPAVRTVLTRLAQAAPQANAPLVVWLSEGAPARVVMVTALRTDEGRPLGAIGVSRPVEDVHLDLRRTAGSTAATVVVFVLLSTLLGALLGQRHLGRPLHDLIIAMRGVRSGGLGARLPETGDEELAQLAAEFNLMIAELGEARARVAAEADARRESALALQAANRLVTLGQLSAALAHEIGSPLQVLIGRARSLAERSDDPARTSRSAEVLVRECERITRIVSQLLNLTRRPAPRRLTVDLTARVAQVCDLMKIEARRRGVTLEALGAGPTCVLGDPDALEQVIFNLVNNALAACEAGGRVTAHARVVSDGVELCVTDDGVGMTPEVLSHAAEPLFTTRAEQGGTGLGLAIVTSIVQEHSGRVHFQTEPGRGCVVTITFPPHAPALGQTTEAAV